MSANQAISDKLQGAVVNTKLRKFFIADSESEKD